MAMMLEAKPMHRKSNYWFASTHIRMHSIYCTTGNPIIGNEYKQGKTWTGGWESCCICTRCNTSSGQHDHQDKKYFCWQLVHWCGDWQSGHGSYPSERLHTWNPFMFSIWHHSPRTFGTLKTVGQVEDADTLHTSVHSGWRKSDCDTAWKLQGNDSHRRRHNKNASSHSFSFGGLCTNGRHDIISSCGGRHSLGKWLGRCSRTSLHKLFLVLVYTSSVPLSVFWAAMLFFFLTWRLAATAMNCGLIACLIAPTDTTSTKFQNYYLAAGPASIIANIQYTTHVLLKRFSFQNWLSDFQDFYHVTITKSECHLIGYVQISSLSYLGRGATQMHNHEVAIPRHNEPLVCNAVWQRVMLPHQEGTADAQTLLRTISWLKLWIQNNALLEGARRSCLDIEREKRLRGLPASPQPIHYTGHSWLCRHRCGSRPTLREHCQHRLHPLQQGVQYWQARRILTALEETMTTDHSLVCTLHQ